MQRDKKYYDDFFAKHGAGVHYDPIRFSKIADLCRGRVLDVACGTGTLSDFYKGNYVGIDISDVAIKLARGQRRIDADFIQTDFFDQSYSSLHYFDTIVMAEFMEHIDDTDAVVKRALELVTSNGRIIVSVPNGDRVPDESHCREFTVPQLRKLFAKYGLVRFHNYPGFTGRIMMTCDVGLLDEKLVSVVIPAKNEGLGLEAAILSCIGFVDEIIVSVDDSSFDDTEKIAIRYADIVKKYHWENSFAKCRMFAQDGAKCKWVLVLDGHEIVDCFSRIKLEEIDDVDALEVPVILENGFKFCFPRLIKSGTSWQGDVHNWPVIKSRVFFGECVIKHDRDHFQAKAAIAIRDTQRSEMVFSIMNKEVKKDPKNPRPWFYMAQQLMVQSSFSTAIKCYKRYLKYSKHKGERWLAFYEMSCAHVQLDHWLRALWCLRDADKEVPNRWEIAKKRGAIFAKKGKYKDAVIYLVDSLKQNTGLFTYCPEKRDDAHTWDLIGHCLLRLKDYPEAKVAFRRAIHLEKEKVYCERNHDHIRVWKQLLKM